MSNRDSPASASGAPDFYIVGQPKAGTTAICEMLRRHPQVYVPAVKEPFFMSGELRETALGTPVPTTWADYVSLYAHAAPDQLTGDLSTLNLWSADAAENIVRARPDAKIVVVLREPVGWVRSFHMQMVQSRHESKTDLRAAISAEPERRRRMESPRPLPDWQSVLLYSEHVRYVDQLKRYAARFAPEQMLVLTYDEFGADNVATVQRIQRFIGVDDRPLEATRANPTIRIRSTRLDRTLLALKMGSSPGWRAVKQPLKRFVPDTHRRAFLRLLEEQLIKAPPKPQDPTLEEELRERFRSEVLRLDGYLGRDFSKLWGYR